MPLPADERGLTIFPERGQEQHIATESHPLDIEELCELLMSKARIRRMRENMPNPMSDAVMPAAVETPSAAENELTEEVIDLPVEAGPNPTVVQRPDGQGGGWTTEYVEQRFDVGVRELNDTQTQAGEWPLVLPSGRLTTEDFKIKTDCFRCRLSGMNSSCRDQRAGWAHRKVAAF